MATGEPGSGTENSAAGGVRVHLVIPTHTTRHLAACVGSLARATRPPATVVVTCDTDEPAIGALLDEVWPRVVRAIEKAGRRAPVLIHTGRAHQGRPRLNQVRNNGLRALNGAAALRDDDLVVVVDGDTVLEETALERHRALAGEGCGMILPYRVNLDAERTAGVMLEWLLDRDGERMTARLLRGADLAALRARQARADRQMLLRRLRLALAGLPKGHKPKLLGGHHAVFAGLLRGVNGYDEHFGGDGTDDDDLARRLYMLRPAPVPICPITQILAFHLYHETRRPWRPTEAPDHARFARKLSSPRAERGWEWGIEQPAPFVRTVSPAGARSGGGRLQGV